MYIDTYICLQESGAFTRQAVGPQKGLPPSLRKQPCVHVGSSLLLLAALSLASGLEVDALSINPKGNYVPGVLSEMQRTRLLTGILVFTFLSSGLLLHDHDP